jgi:hypothetical protein
MIRQTLLLLLLLLLLTFCFFARSSWAVLLSGSLNVVYAACRQPRG